MTVDDDFLSDTPIRLVQAGSVAQVPVLISTEFQKRRTDTLLTFDSYR